MTCYNVYICHHILISNSLIYSQQDLEKFKRKSDNLFNFRCPHCGDSKKSSSKARGFVYRKKNDMFFKCHNCGVGQTLGNLIKFLDPTMHKEYVFERFKDGKVE